MEDKEIKAMSDIIISLEALEPSARSRVIKYVVERLSMTPLMSATESTQPQIIEPVYRSLHVRDQESVSGMDIRSLKETKSPKSAIQMTALVAYYLQEVAPEIERKESINVDDIKKYFNQAGFPLPKITRLALLNTKAAGYLESVDRGQFRLNPVGYNLVAYGLPAKNGSSNAKKVKKTISKKSKTKKSKK